MSPRDAVKEGVTTFATLVPFLRHTIAISLMLVTGTVAAYNMQQDIRNEISRVVARLDLATQKYDNYITNHNDSALRLAQNTAAVSDRVLALEKDQNAVSNSLAIATTNQENLKEDLGELKSSLRGLSLKQEEYNRDNQKFQQEVIQLLRQRAGDSQ